jgi:hypothetical protein
MPLPLSKSERQRTRGGSLGCGLELAAGCHAFVDRAARVSFRSGRRVPAAGPGNARWGYPNL